MSACSSVLRAIARVAMACGAWIGLVAATVSGQSSNKVLDLDGNGDYVRFPPNIFNDLEEATVEGWVKWRSFNSYSRFFDFGSIWHSMLLCNEGTGGSLYFALSNGEGNEVKVIVPDALETGQWYHIAVVTGGGGIRVYLDGVSVGGDPHTGSFAWTESGRNNYLGRSNWRTDEFFDEDFNGQMDEVRVWRTQRTAEQIRENMNRRLTGRENGLFTLWNFDELDETADKVRDLARGRHDGELLGNATGVEEEFPKKGPKDQGQADQLEEDGDELVLVIPDGGSWARIPAGILDGLTEVTIEGWMRWDGNQEWSEAIAFNHPGDVGLIHKLSVGQSGESQSGAGYANTLRLNLEHLGGAAADWGTRVFVDNVIALHEWIHVAAVIDANGGRLYVNGELKTRSADVKLSRLKSNRDNYLGQNGFVGRLDEVRIWKVARSDEEIRNNALGKLRGDQGGKLLAAWNFDDPDNPWEDVSGNENHLSPGGQPLALKSTLPDALVRRAPLPVKYIRRPSFVPPGDLRPQGASLVLTNPNGYLVLPPGLFPKDSLQGTVEAWVKLHDIVKRGNQMQRIFSYGEPGEEIQLCFDRRSSAPCAFVGRRSAARDTGLFSEVEVPVGQWAHVALSFNGNRGRLYLNGREIASSLTSYGEPTIVETSLGYLGALPTSRGNDTPFLGEIAEVRTWDYERKATAIYESFQKTVTGNEGGLTGYFRFADAGALDKDSSSRGKNGRVRGKVLQNRPGKRETEAPREAYRKNIGWLELDGGRGSYLKLPSDLLRGAGDEVTIEGWVRWDSSDSASPFLSFSKNDFSFQIRPGGDSGKQATVEVKKGNGTIIAHSRPWVGLEEWTHVAVVISKDNRFGDRVSPILVYLNGSLAGWQSMAEGVRLTNGRPNKDPYPHPDLESNTENYLGVRFPDDWNAFRGAVDELRVWKGGRTAGEIQEYWLKNLTDEEVAREKKLLALWRFDDPEEQGRDSSGNGHTAEFFGGARVTREQEISLLAEETVPEVIHPPSDDSVEDDPAMEDDATGMNADVTVDARVRGVVTDVNGKPMPEVLVRLMQGAEEVAATQSGPGGASSWPLFRRVTNRTGSVPSTAGR